MQIHPSANAFETIKMLGFVNPLSVSTARPCVHFYEPLAVNENQITPSRGTQNPRVKMQQTALFGFNCVLEKR